MDKKLKIFITVVVALFLSVATHMAPMFFSVPKYIYLNIAGTVLILLLYGPLAGGIYAAFLHIGLNNIGMGMGTQLPVMLVQVGQAIILGFLLEHIGRMKIFLAPLVMSLISLPLSIIIHSIFNKNLFEGLKSLGGEYVTYIQNNLVDNLLMYFISIVVALTIIKISRIKEK